MNEIKKYFSQDAVQARFKELLGKKSAGFVTSVLQVVSSNDLLSKALPESVFHAAAVAATLDLPINYNLGFAYIIPYNSKTGTVAQFQIGYKGFIQMAQRTGQYKTISASPIYEGQLIAENPLTGFQFDFTQKKSDVIIGYAAYFSLTNGFEKVLFMSIQELKNHGLRFSQTFKKGFGLWKDDFNSMAMKTVLKQLLSKFAPLSIEVQAAIKFDQSVVKDEMAEQVEYIDNEEPEVNKESERILMLIEAAQKPEDLEAIREHIEGDQQTELFADKMESLKSGKHGK